MRLAQVRQHKQHKGPDADEERDHEQQDLPLWNRHVPQETPVSTIWLDPTYSDQVRQPHMKSEIHTPLSQ